VAVDFLFYEKGIQIYYLGSVKAALVIGNPHKQNIIENNYK
jgi:hypothetical protein